MAPFCGPPRHPFRRCLAFATTLACASAQTGAPAPEEPLTRIAEVRQLPRNEAARSRSVRVTGVVTWRGLRGQMIVQDDSDGCWIYVDEARKRKLFALDDATLGSIRVGHVLEIEGSTDPGSYAPGIMPRSLRIVGEGPLPPPQPMDPRRFYTGAEANRRVAVRGVVQGYHPAEGGWLLEFSANPGRFTVEVMGDSLPDPAALVDAEVSVTGVAVTRVNTRGEITLPRVYSTAADRLVVEVPATAPFDAPLVPLDRLLPFRPEPRGPHRQRVIGTVTLALPGKFLYLHEGHSAVRVETHSLERFQAGDRVEAAGFVNMTRYVGTLAEAHVRKVGAAGAPAAVAINPEEILALNRDAMIAGKLAQPHDYDGHLVRFRAGLLAVQADPDRRQSWRRLTLERGDMILSAILHEGASRDIDALRPGSLLEVTGIVQLEYTPVAAPRLSLMPTRLDIVLRDAADVTVVRAPSWWTPGRLLGMVAVVAVAFGAALVWAGQLRRQVRRKTQELASEMRARRDAAVEFQATLRERNRLAANLHDTLLQTLGAIGFQIGASEAEARLPGRDGQPLAHLAVTRRILDHAVKEVRGSVWALRSLPLQGQDLPAALRAMAERVGEGHAARITVRAEGGLEPVSDFVAGNLLLAAQEALHNALKHGAPPTITLEVRPAEKPHWITLVIRDDGRGFNPAEGAGVAQGHFGLVGMKERIERLDGTFRLESAPGAGTTLRIEVPLRSYDETVA